MKRIYIYIGISLFIMISSFKSEDLPSTHNMKYTIWFEKIPPSITSISIPIPIPIALPVTPSIPIKFSFKNNKNHIETESITVGDELIIKKRGALRSIIGVFESYDLNSRRLFINDNNTPKTILLDDIASIHFKLPGKKRATLAGAFLGFVVSAVPASIANDYGNSHESYKILGNFVITGALLGSLFTSPKSRLLIRFNHAQFEYRVAYHE